MTTIHWGIIGLGKIAHKFAADLLTVEGAKLHAVASRDQEKADAIAATYKASKAYDSYEALVQDPKVDAIYIATPHALHNTHTLMCLNHKKAVLCEKPFAMNLHEVDEMIAAAKANQTLLMEALWTYFLPHYQFALKHLSDNTFGALRKIEADFGFKPAYDTSSRVFKKSLGGGSLLDIGIYPIFAALSNLGMPVHIESKATFFENEVDASCFMLFTYGQAEAHLKSTLLENTPTQAIFSCDNGTLKINSRFHEPTTVTLISEDKEETIDFGYTTIGYNFEIQHFNELLRQGKTESDLMSFEFSRNLISILDTVRRQIGLSYP